MGRVSVILTLFLLMFSHEVVSPAFDEPRTKTNAVVSKTVSAPQQSRQQAALALIDFQWQKLGYEIVFRPAKRGFRAMTFAPEKRIEIYARPGDDSRLLAYDI